jgi:hypothetical protein
MKYATKKQLEDAVKEGNWSWLGWQFWNAFITLPKSNKIRKYHSKIYDSLTKEQKEAAEIC